MSLQTRIDRLEKAQAPSGRARANLRLPSAEMRKERLDRGFALLRNDPDGRALLHHICEMGGTFAYNPEASAYVEGRRALALEILNATMSEHPSSFAAMLQEKLNHDERCRAADASV